MASRVLFYVFLLPVMTRGHAESSAGGSMLYFAGEPEDSVVGRGEALRLDCSVRRSSAADDPVLVQSGLNVTWFHNGRPLPVPDPRRTLLPNGTLYFDKVLPKRPGRNSFDEGSYFCIVGNEFGALISREATVRVASLEQEFVASPVDTRAEASSVVRLLCQIDSVPAARITWEKDGRPLVTPPPDDVSASSANHTSRFVALESGVLQIHEVQPDDSGNYRCVAWNAVLDKSKRSPVGKLVVTPRVETTRKKPQFLVNTNNTELWITEGRNASVECLAWGWPTPRVTWTVNGSSEGTELPQRVSVERGYLFVRHVDAALTADYTCHASADNGTTTTSQTIRLRVAVPPFFLLVPKSQVFPTAKTVRFECGVAGNPLPTVRWFKDGRPLTIGGRIKQRTRSGGTVSELVLSNTVTADSGFYQCVAKNSAGTISSAAHLLVNITEGRPEPPGNIQATSLTPTEILLAWDPPANVPVEEITAYTVHYMQTLGGEELQDVALNNSFRFEKLRPYTNYTFYVRAYSRKSASDQSERITFISGAKAEGSSGGYSATNVTLTAISPTSLKVTWPRSLSAQSKLHRIQYRRHKQSDYLIEVVKGDVNEYVITGLHPGKKYDVRFIPAGVRINVSDSGLPWITKEMPRGRNTAPLMQLTSSNSSSIRVTWEPPNNGRKQASAYRVFFRKDGSRIKGPATLSASADRSYVITGLSPNSLHEVQILAVYDDGDGPAASKYIRTLADASEEPGDDSATYDVVLAQIEVELITSKTVKISWEVPGPLADFSFFTVKFQTSPGTPLEPRGLYNGQRELSTGYLRTTTQEAQIVGLLPYTAYQLSIRYHDTLGRFSKFSPSIEFRTLPDMPSAPQSFSHTAANSKSIQLQWEPPQNPNGIIVSYQIQVSDDPTFLAKSVRVFEESGAKLRTVVRDLSPDTLYYVRSRAKTTAGFGSWTELLVIHTQAEKTTSATSSKESLNPESKPDDPVDKDHQFIIIGLALGAVFVVLCSAVALWRSRCIKRISTDGNRRSSRAICLSGRELNDRASLAQISGNGFRKAVVHKETNRKVRRKKNGSQDPADKRNSAVEMESFTPMLATIPVEISGHIDTKGGYPSSSGNNIPSLLRRSSLSHSSKDQSVDPLLDQTATTSHQSTILGLDYYSSEDRRYADHVEDDVDMEETCLNGDSSCLTRATEDTCLSMSISMNQGLGLSSSPSHSHNNSLQSLGACTEESQQSNDSQRNWSDDNDTGICSVGPSTRSACQTASLADNLPCRDHQQLAV